MANSIILTSKSIDIDSSCVIVDTNTVEETSISQSKPVKRSRKSSHPSKTVQASADSTFTHRLIQTSSKVSINELFSTETSPAHEKSNLPHEQENNDDDAVMSDEGSSITNINVAIKRPRLTHRRRLAANARERERVHNLSAAFESLRQVIPMYGDQPKLSRLSILRIACSYVLLLGSLNEIDFSQERNAYTFNECFHILSSTILNELKRRKIK